MSTDIEEYLLNLSKELNIVATQKGIHHKEQDLITLVRNCPFLYDKKKFDYKNCKKKDDTWVAIAKILNSTASECKNRWHSLREIYGRQKRKMRRIPPEELKEHYLWEYMKEMNFLEDHVIPRRKRFGYCSTKGIEEEDVHSTDTETNIPPEIEADLDNNFTTIITALDPIGKDTFDANLITLVKNAPVLYKTGKNSERKDQIWKVIAKTLHVPVDDCVGRWKLLRQRFSKERSSLEKDPQHSRWELLDELDFLSNFVKRRKKPDWFKRVSQSPQTDETINANSNESSNLDQLLEFADNSEEIEIQKLEFIDPSYLDCGSVEVQSSNPIDMPPPLAPLSTVNKQEKIAHCSEDSVIEIQNDLNDNPSSTIRVVRPRLTEQVPEISVATHDEDDFFGQTIALELKKISRKRKKMRLKADIFKLLLDAQSDSDE